MQFIRESLPCLSSLLRHEQWHGNVFAVIETYCLQIAMIPLLATEKEVCREMDFSAVNLKCL